MSVPKNYRSMQDFAREELGQHSRPGFSLEDFMQETTFEGGDVVFDDSVDDYDRPAVKRSADLAMPPRRSSAARKAG